MVEHDVIEAAAPRDTDVLDLAQVETFMSKVFNSHHSRREATQSHPVIQGQVEVQSMRDFDEIEMLLGKASKTIEILATRCEILEHELAESADKMTEHEQTSNRWKNVALELRSQAEADRVRIKELQTKNEEAEAHIASLKTAADEAQERIAAADARSSRLHSQVIAAFGRKSPVHSLMQAVTYQEAAE